MPSGMGGFEVKEEMGVCAGAAGLICSSDAICAPSDVAPEFEPIAGGNSVVNGALYLTTFGVRGRVAGVAEAFVEIDIGFGVPDVEAFRPSAFVMVADCIRDFGAGM